MTQPADERLTNPGEFVPPPAEAPPVGFYGSPGFEYGYPSGWAPVDAGPSFVADDAVVATPLTPLLACLALLWAVGAVGAVIAPFLTLYGYSFSSSISNQVISVDGWGRVTSPAGGTAAHSSIWGIPLVIAAAALLLACFGLLFRRTTRWPAVLGLLTTTALATTVGGVVLDWDALSSEGSIGRIDPYAGAGFWLLLMVGVVAAVATLLALRAVLDSRPEVSWSRFELN